MAENAEGSDKAVKKRAANVLEEQEKRHKYKVDQMLDEYDKLNEAAEAKKRQLREKIANLDRRLLVAEKDVRERDAGIEALLGLAVDLVEHAGPGKCPISLKCDLKCRPCIMNRARIKAFGLEKDKDGCREPQTDHEKAAAKRILQDVSGKVFFGPHGRIKVRFAAEATGEQCAAVAGRVKAMTNNSEFISPEPEETNGA